MAKKRGLGKSLDALLVGSGLELLLSEKNTEETILALPLDCIQRGKYQPRREIDSQALEGLAASIRAQGVIQPIVVRVVGINQYEIIAGERRWRAAQLAKQSTIPAIVRDIPNQAVAAVALIENIQRENLNPIEEAFALQRLLEEFGLTHQQAAESVGRSRTSVTNLLRLLTLTEAVRQMVEQKQLEMGHARALLALPADSQIEVANYIVQNELSVRDTEEYVRKIQMPTLPPAIKSMDPDIKRLQDDIGMRLHLKVAIQCNAKGRGKMVIRYNNLSELDKILRYFQN